MSTAISLPPIEVLGAAAEAIATEAREAQDFPTMRATDKAMLQLIEGTSPVPTIGGWLLESRTRPGIVHRLSVAHGCSCEAAINGGRVCWHRQLMAIVERAAQQFTMPNLTAPTQAEAQAAVDELFAY
jgi:hypothetical protein